MTELLGQARLVAGAAFREVRRRPSVWLATLLTGVLFAGLLAMVGLVTERVQGRAEERTFKVAVGGDLEGGAELIERIEADPRLDLVARDDPEGQVTEQRASVGLVLPDGVDASLARGDDVELDLSYRLNNPVSYEAFVTLSLRLQALDLEELAGGRDLPPPDVVLAVDGIARDARLGRLQLARQLSAVAALLCIGIVSAVAAGFGAARERRALEPLLVLPLRRSALAAGMAAGALPVAALQVVGGMVLLVGTAALPASAAHQGGAVLAQMMLAAVVAAVPLAVLACAVGTLAGSVGTGTDDAVSLGDLLALPFVVVGIVLFTRQAVASTLLTSLIPGVGHALLVREAVNGTVEVIEVAGVLLSTVVSVSLLLHLAGRLLGDERRLLRATR